MDTDKAPGDMPADGPWLIQEVLAELGWNADPAAFADRVRRLDVGLPVEDEFSVLCSWLGKCTILHKLDQQQVPRSSKERFQVPDLLAKFSTQSTDRPLLIEVKSGTDPKLSLKGSYLAKLQAYASMMELPLLIAWKHHSLWALFEAKHLKKAKTSFHIDFSTALSENLLGVLAGDVAFKMGPRAGLRLRFRKSHLVSTETVGDEVTEQWHMVVDEVRFTDYNGDPLQDIDAQLESIFICSGLEEKQEETQTHFFISYGAPESGIQFSHRALVELLHWEGGTSGRPNWRRALSRDVVTKSLPDFTGALNKALQLRIVSHIFHQMPKTMPDFVGTERPAR